MSPSTAAALPMPMPARDPSAAAARVRAAVREHYDFLWRSLRRLGVPEEGVDDAAQAVLVIFARRVDDVRPGSERSFLFGTATRVASDARKKLKRTRDVKDERALTTHADPTPTPDDLLDQLRARAVLDEVLEELPSELRAVFVLAEFEDMTMVEIAELVGIPQGTVASRLRRARALFEEHAEAIRVRRQGGAK